MKKVQWITVCILISIFTSTGLNVTAQEVDPHDFGKMWTFENPPKKWFLEKYGFEASDEWFDHLQKSTLFFGGGCSASFVSPDGLIMTNHHCSTGSTAKVEMDGEDFTNNGFYAKTLADERKSEGLSVKQLIHAIDITQELEDLSQNNQEFSKKELYENIKSKYAQKKDWKDLKIRIVEYYSGAKASILGHKIYSDIRLVMVPEVNIGFFGGEDDNFTYPRYNLDFTFWRAYNDEGNPVNSSENYLMFNHNGPKEGDPVFVVGNPANTERYRTVAQLEYDKVYRYPMTLDFLTNRQNHLKNEYLKNNDPKLRMQMIYLGNSLKVYTGILEGLKNKELFQRKINMENKIRNESGKSKDWMVISDFLENRKEHAWAMNLLGPSRLRGFTFLLMHSLNKYEKQLLEGENGEELKATREEINYLCSRKNDAMDRDNLILTLKEVQKYIPENNDLLSGVLGKKSIEEYVDKIYKKSLFFDDEKRGELLDLDAKKFLKKKDPLLRISRKLIPAYDEAASLFISQSKELKEAQKNIARIAFDVFGEDLPPDATASKRISDGLVKGFDYNGTIAPYKTTFFGLYDRYYSFEGKESWMLPSRWLNPPVEFLSYPVNFVSTNDIIGGNSGSPIVNIKMEVVGLVFDGNIESLPGNFIFDDEYNRTVSVHVGGMLAAMKYIYKADRLYAELMGKR